MIDHIDEVISEVCTPPQFKGSLFDINGDLSLNCAKIKIVISLPQEDCNDEVSTNTSSNFCSQTFEVPDKLPRKRSTSGDFTSTFEKIYSNVESFLDTEGLHITSPSPVVQCKTLKPCMKMSELTVLTQNFAKGQNSPCLSAGPMSKSAMPSFMVKRTASSGNVTKVKYALFAETKRNSAMSTFSSTKDSEPQTPLIKTEEKT